MSFLDRIAACNNADLARFRPLRIGGIHVGYVYPAFAERLAAFPDVFQLDAEGVSMVPALDTAPKRDAAIDRVTRQLAAEGVIKGWRDERYPILPLAGGGAPMMTMERAAVPHFGARAFGVHMNGFVRKTDGIHLWVGKRADNRPAYPGMLDNTVAGGMPAGLSPMETLVKECGEEAAIPPALARQAVAVGAITYNYEADGGMRPDVQYCYDLELPADFTPHNADGEIAEFMLWPAERVAEIVRDTAEFKFNCNLVIIDFLIRHGHITPDRPDYGPLARAVSRTPLNSHK